MSGRFDDKQVVGICKMLDKGYTIAKIAEEHRVSKQYIRKFRTVLSAVRNGNNEYIERNRHTQFPSVYIDIIQSHYGKVSAVEKKPVPAPAAVSADNMILHGLDALVAVLNKIEQHIELIVGAEAMTSNRLKILAETMKDAEILVERK